MVSKICTELDNHLGMNDKDLAEFIIDLAETNTTFDTFKKALIENGAEFPDSFISNLLRIIQLMKTSKKTTLNDDVFKAKDEADKLAMKFPGLAMPNKSQKDILEEVVKDEKKDDKKDIKPLNSVADDMLAELEAFAPSKSGIEIDSKKVEKRERSKERERKSRRDRSRDKDRDRDRDRSREKDRDKDRERERDRDRDRDKERSSRRSRSRDRQGRSR